MNTPETKTAEQADRNRSEPVYLTPEQIQAQIPPDVNTTLNPWKVKMTQQDMDRMVAIINEARARHSTENNTSEPGR